MDFEIRAVREAEWEELRELRLSAQGGQTRSRVIVAQARDGSWIGTARMGLAVESSAEEPLPVEVDALPVVEIMGVFVRPEHRGGGDSGVAARMVRESCDWANTEFGAAWAVLDVRDDNPRALAFYRKLGFTDSGIRLPSEAVEPGVPGSTEVRMMKRL